MRNRGTLPRVEPLSRRAFVKLSTAAGLLLGVQLPGCAPVAEQGDGAATGLRDELDPSAAPIVANAFVAISPDDIVTVTVHFQEMGQGTATGCATLVAEELDADWADVRVAYAPANAALYRNLAMGFQGTGGSSAMRGCYEQMRKAGAGARALLVQAAAAKWSVSASEVTVVDGVVSHASGQKARFGELASLAAQQKLPAEVTLKDPAKFKLIGKDGLRRVDTLAKSDGTQTYTIDVKLPGLLTAVIVRKPSFSAKLVSFDAAPALAVRGVTDVVQIPEGVAVVGTGMWPALKGSRALQVEWDQSADAALSSEGIFAEYRTRAATPGAQVTKSPDAEAKLAAAAKKLEAVYELPYLAHAPMEPLNCVAWLHDGMLETWTAHQIQTIDHQQAARAAGLPQDKVVLHTLPAGGSFGRRASFTADYVVEAVNVAKAINGRAPVRVQRTREDDMRAGQYRPLNVHKVTAGLSADGKLEVWRHTIVGQPVLAQSLGPVDPMAIEGAWPLPYAVPSAWVDLHSTKQAVTTLPWRSVGHSFNAFVVETMIDELAEAAGEDPVAFRLARLTDKPRHRAVLSLCAEKSGWGTPAPEGTARGIVQHASFSSFVAIAVEVRLRDDGTPKVERAVVAVDCGVVINPDVVRAQMEGGLGFGLSAALYSELNIDKGAVKEGNFDTYPTLRIDEMPKVEVHIVASSEKPTGVGEIAVPPIGPAVANALYKLTGKRVRRLPIVRYEG
ncbi:MAG: xanthine dehydrogenase family protein molybdopterin-binding subunit [Polyangiales bacterium]